VSQVRILPGAHFKNAERRVRFAINDDERVVKRGELLTPGDPLLALVPNHFESVEVEERRWREGSPRKKSRPEERLFL
jgi:hypothetical protein